MHNKNTNSLFNKVIVMLGSNINPQYNIQTAIDKLKLHFTILKQAKSLKTKPVGVIGVQPDFINTGCLIITKYSYKDIVRTLKEIENEMGREPNSPDKPRPIDLDLAVWNDDIVDEDIYQRDFLQTILFELSPEFKNVLISKSSPVFTKTKYKEN